MAVVNEKAPIDTNYMIKVYKKGFGEFYVTQEGINELKSTIFHKIKLLLKEKMHEEYE